VVILISASRLSGTIVEYKSDFNDDIHGIILMPMLLFMPWCILDRAYDVGEIEILPFERDAAFAECDEAVLRDLNTLLAAYKTIQGESVRKLAIVRYKGRSPIDDLSDDQIGTAYDLVTLATFAGLSAREFFNAIGSYCNSDCFTMYVQTFEDTTHTALTTRRREGSQVSVWPIDGVAMVVPPHCHTVRTVNLDEELLGALVKKRSGANTNEWSRWLSSISCFNQANTDSEGVRPQSEWVLLCGALQHLLNAGSKDKAVATELHDALVPIREILIGAAKRRLPNWTDETKSVRYAWMKEFYGIRGDFAHGRLNTQRPAAWTLHEHLVLGSIAFPLVAKTLLRQSGEYEFTHDDEVQQNSFESLADTANFLRPPDEQQGGLDSHWARVRQQAQHDIRVAEAMRAFEAIRVAQEEERSVESE